MCDGFGFNAGLFIRCLLVLFETSCLIVGRDWTWVSGCDSVVCGYDLGCLSNSQLALTVLWFFITVEA
jgi:hypothetical protein